MAHHSGMGEARRPSRFLSGESAANVRLAARIIGAGALFAYAIPVRADGFPLSATEDAWQLQVQVAALAWMVIAYVVGLRWDGPGGMMMLIGSAGLAVHATRAFEPAVAAFGAVAFAVPGMLLVLAWQADRSPRAIAVLAGAGAIALVAGAAVTGRIHDEVAGPTHPRSPLAALPVDLVEWVWAGGTTTTGFTVAARMAEETDEAWLLVSTSRDLAEPFRIGPVAAPDDQNRVARFVVEGLEPGTEYFYAVEAGGRVERQRRGRVRTFPEGPASFTLAFGSCASTGSSTRVFDTIRGHDPLLVLLLGDLHYMNIGSDDLGAFRWAYDRILSSPAQSALYRTTSVDYVWDDHDYGANNSDRTSASRRAARLAYQENVPHYPLAAGEGDVPIAHAFTIGRVRFIVTDNRSERDPNRMADGPDKSMLGEAQLAWFKQELLDAKGRYPLIVWVNSVPWIAPAKDGADTWGGFAHEREEIARFIAENEIPGVVILSGDAHMLAIDDGRNSDYAPGGGAAMPVFHAAALDRRGATKGGPYSEGMYPGGGQFGLMRVFDEGSQIRVEWTGRNYRDEVLVSLTFTVSAGAATTAGVETGAALAVPK